MSDLPNIPQDTGFWSGVGATVAAGIAVLSNWSKNKKVHKLRNEVNEVKLVNAVLSTHYKDIDRRLGGIEVTQRRMDDKLNRLIERGD